MTDADRISEAELKRAVDAILRALNKQNADYQTAIIACVNAIAF